LLGAVGKGGARVHQGVSGSGGEGGGDGDEKMTTAEIVGTATIDVTVRVAPSPPLKLWLSVAASVGI